MSRSDPNFGYCKHLETNTFLLERNSIEDIQEEAQSHSLPLTLREPITKTLLLKFIENFTTKKTESF